MASGPRAVRPTTGGRAAILAVVLVYLGIVLVGPIAFLGSELVEAGIAAAWQAITSPEALRALRMSLLLAAIALVVNGVVGVAGAVVLVRHRFPGRAVIDTLADLPLAVSPVMVGLGFILLFGRGGWLEPESWKIVFAFPGLVLGTLFVTVPYTVREVVYVLEEIGTDEEEAAATLGASGWQTFWRVTLPNARWGIAYGLLMTVARSLGEFGAVLVIGGSISGRTQTATTFIHDAVEERHDASAFGMAVVLASVSILLLLLLERVKRRRTPAR